VGTSDTSLASVLITATVVTVSLVIIALVSRVKLAQLDFFHILSTWDVSGTASRQK